MSDSGVWGIAQEYFDKVYPRQEKRKRKKQRQPKPEKPPEQLLLSMDSKPK